MGKSPGRWMKTLLFGKKSSRSKSPKGKNELKKIGDKKEVLVSLDSIGSTGLSLNVTERNDGNMEEILESENLQNEVVTPLPHNEDKSIAATTELDAQNDSDRIREEQAATKVQAALRGHLARRVFGTLKGIIRLQALSRGRLVRRQAVSTLYCMFQIVKFQALARGRKIRRSDIGIEVQKRCNCLNHLVAHPVGVNPFMQISNLSADSFTRKILASSPNALPLHFQYDPNDTNSILSWLERWSKSHFWLPIPKPKKGSRPKSEKPNIRNSSVTNVESVSSEFDKPRRFLKKVSTNQPANLVQENPELVLENVKRNLRKVNTLVSDNTLQAENDTEKKSTNDEIKKVTTELAIQITPEPLTANERENQAEEKNVCVVNQNDSVKIERKNPKRRASLPAKQEFMENNEPPQMKRSVPSYMASTESAKAKLRGVDMLEKPNLTRRYSLPSSTNGKTSLLSPRVQRPTQTTGKDGSKNDRSLQLSRDGNVKLNQAEWRR